MNDSLVLTLGIISAGVGGELFVRGTVGLAHWARVSAGIIGATVAAFATSTPELSVAITAALAGTPQISLGDALGSNIINIALILGLTLLTGRMRSSRDDVKRDFLVALFGPVAIGALSIDGLLSRVDGFILLAIFLIWLIAVLVEMHDQRSAAEKILGEHRGWFAVTSILIGLVFLIAAGRLIVQGAKGIGASFGLDVFVIGAGIVAIGTSVPELATALISRIRGHDEVGLGTILGSNIFNGLFIIAVVAVISPIPINWQQVRVALLFGVATVAFTLPTRHGYIGRRRGVLLLVLYAVYVAAIF